MSTSSLEVPRRRRRAQQSKLWRIVAVVGVVVLVVGWAIWFLRTPDGLPISARTADGTGVVDQDIYVGMFAVGDDFDRTLRISEVKVPVEADGDVEVDAKICRGGTISVTSDAERFCDELDDPDGADFSEGDSIVLVVSASEPVDVTIGRIEISFRDGIRWGTKEGGLDGATLRFDDHTPGTVKDDDQSDDSTTPRPEQDDKNGNKDRHGKKDKKRDRNGPAA